MSNGNPPSSRPFLAENPALVEARGTLRDALGALGNLDQLLRSLRVGPKAISAVLPDVLDSCGPAQQAVKELLAAIAGRLGNPGAAAELERYFATRLSELGQSLEQATRTPMHARHRLELERVVTRLTPELAAARALLDLLEEALAAPAIRLKLRELLDEIAVSQRTEETLEVTLRGDLDEVELLVQPQVALALFTLGANWLAAEGEASVVPEIEVESRPDGGYTIRFQGRSGAGERLLLPKQALIAPTRSCLDAAVTHMGCRVEHDSESRSFSVTWG